MDTLENLKRKADALASKARKAEGELADKLFKKAGKIYQQALTANPEYYPALNAWGAALLAQAQMKTGDDSGECFSQAEDVLHQAEVISPGSGSYNLACLAAIRGRNDECRKWLENGPRHGVIPQRLRLENDPDLKNVRGERWFDRFLEKADE
jgi:tetratricopeptide (TPR) repeat protein